MSKKKPGEFKQKCYICGRRTKWINTFDHKNQLLYTQCSKCQCSDDENEQFKKNI